MTFVLPTTDLARIQELCDTRVPPEEREHVRVEVEQERQAVNIVERRPPWREDYGPEWSRLPIARLRCVASKRLLGVTRRSWWFGPVDDDAPGVRLVVDSPVGGDQEHARLVEQVGFSVTDAARDEQPQLRMPSSIRQ